jgi:protein TonB
MSPPALVTIETPEYPPMARRLKVQGTVVVSVLVDEEGRVTETRVVRGAERDVGLNEAAERAARTARFRPATVEGVAVKTWFNLNIPFRL